jgi:bifunctional DNase/RNase
MIEVVIDSVRVSLTNQQRIVVLREVNAERYLPIWIGPYEAEAITIALQEIEVARPQTHDLLKNFLNTFSARLVRVEVVALKDDVFFGNLVVEHNDRLIEIDSRPSDALALAVRAHVPILVSREVMETAGIIPERDLQTSEPAPAEPAVAPVEDENLSEERLSVFEDFLQNLKIDDDPGKEQDEEDPDKNPPDEDSPKQDQ